MLFWIIAALLTLGACLAVLLPLTRAKGAAESGSHDLEVYRDQLAELERDASRGLIGAAEAEEARAEIGRRILKAHDAEKRAERGTGRAPRWAAFAVVLAVPVVSWGAYALLGSPRLPAQPLAARLERDPAQNTVEELVARAEAHLRANPSDGRGWEVLAPIYSRIGRHDEAVAAWKNAIRLNGTSAARQAGLGEALAARGGGVVSAEAQAAFERALALAPGDPRARFYLATGYAQEGRLADAADEWRKLAAEAPTDSPWRSAAEQALQQAEQELAAAEAPGPDAADVDAAAGMGASQRAEMIETMVASLDERLRANPDDREGWKRLVRSYMVLGRPDDARDALRRGVAGLGSEGAEELKEFAAELGVKETE
jgi:cytochrome c-type biogenesis protein CcmH